MKTDQMNIVTFQQISPVLSLSTAEKEEKGTPGFKFTWLNVHLQDFQLL